MQRREFLKLSTASASALTLGFVWPTATAHATSLARDALPFQPNAYLRIDVDGTVTIVAPRPEAGSDVRTSLPMIVAEELDVAWATVEVVQADTDAARYGTQRIWGSEAVTTEFDKLRTAGALARMMLVEAAAKTWNVPAAECVTDTGRVSHARSGRQLGYGKLVARARLVPVPARAELKAISAFKLIGTSQKKWDGPAIVTGRAQYGIDVRVPNMVVAVVARGPSFGARVRRFDATKAKAVAGVIAVTELAETRWVEFPSPVGASQSPVEPLILVPSGVAVIAKTTWAAMQGRKALEIEWDESAGVDEDSATLQAKLRSALNQPGTEVFAKPAARDDGAGKGAGVGAAAIVAVAGDISADYMLPFLAHATMEPMNCVADVRADRAEFWAPVGEPQRIVKDIGVNLLGLKAENVKVHTTLIGGSFGRRSQVDYAAEAALISRHVGRPVQLLYTREDDMRRGYYRPMSGQRLSATVGVDGAPLTWHHHIATTARQGNLSADRQTVTDVKHLSEWDSFGGAAGDLWYPVPEMRTGYTPIASVVPRASWRAVAHSHNVFAIESFIDELARSAGQDPLAYRLNLLKRWQVPPFERDRLTAVIERAAKDADWKKPLPPGWGRGIACMPYEFNKVTYIAQVVEVAPAAGGGYRVHRVVSAVDCGIVINPSGAKAQIEGGSLFGLSAALYGEITVTAGRVAQSNFHDYQLMRLREAPHFETHLMSSEAAPGPLGEVATATIFAAFGNAVTAARGRAVRELPLRA